VHGKLSYFEGRKAEAVAAAAYRQWLYHNFFYQIPSVIFTIK
jgi:hypothetical protein